MELPEQFKYLEFRKEFSHFHEDLYIKALTDNYSPIMQGNIISNTLKEKRLSEIIFFLNSIGIDKIALLKGIYLLKTVYRLKPWIRNMSDIDILIPEKCYHKALNSVSERYEIKKQKLGFIRMRHQFGFYINESFIEIHRAQSSFNRFNINYLSFFDDSSLSSDNYGSSFSLPSFEKTAIFSLIHNFSQNISELDIRRIVETEIIIACSDRDKLLKEVREDRIEHLLAFHSAIYSALIKTPESVFGNLKAPISTLLLKRGDKNIFSEKYNRTIKFLLLFPSLIKMKRKTEQLRRTL